MANSFQQTLADSTNKTSHNLEKITEDKNETEKQPRSKSPPKIAPRSKKMVLSKIGKFSSFPVMKTPESSLPKLTDQYVITDQYDLYNPTPSVGYLKEKYRMYLDWLSENSSDNSESNNSDNCQLNWYNYENKVYSSENSNSLRFLKNLKKMSSSQDGGIDTNRSLRLSTTNSSIKDLVKNKNKNHSSMSFYKSDLETDRSQVKRRFSDLTRPFDRSTKGHFIKVPQAFNRPNPQSELINLNKFEQKNKRSLVKSNSVLSHRSKGVQFEARNHLKRESIDPIKLPIVQPRSSIMKPILKFPNDYFSISLSEGSNSCNSSSESSEEPEKIKSLKLPPIVGCSDDFYAVLRDMETENQLEM